MSPEQSHADTTPRRFNPCVASCPGCRTRTCGKHQDFDGMVRFGEMLLPNADRHCVEWYTMGMTGLAPFGLRRAH